jgi:hypothetical protein
LSLEKAELEELLALTFAVLEEVALTLTSLIARE